VTSDLRMPSSMIGASTIANTIGPTGKSNSFVTQNDVIHFVM
jgi:hypothetical protein